MIYENLKENDVICRRLLRDGFKIKVGEATTLCQKESKTKSYIVKTGQNEYGSKYKRRLEKDLEQEIKLRDELVENSENLDKDTI